MGNGMRLRDRLMWMMPGWFHGLWATLTGWRLQAQTSMATGEVISLMWVPVEENEKGDE